MGTILILMFSFFEGHNMCISGTNDSMIEERLILHLTKCKYTEWYGILPNTNNPHLCGSVKPLLPSLL